MTRLVGFNELNVVAAINDVPGGGDLADPDATCNLAGKSPVLHLDKTVFHTDFFHYGLAVPPSSKVINHPSLAVKSSVVGILGFTLPGSSSPNGVYATVKGDVQEYEHTLFTHNLGYSPKYMVSYGGAVLCDGMLVQQESGAGRYVSTFATSSIIGLKEIAVSGSSALAAVSRSYTVYIYGNPTVDPAKKLIDRDGDTLLLGRGKVRSDRAYLRRVTAGESSIDIDLGPTLDNNNGGFRIVTGGNTFTDHLYSGSFTGPGYIPVGGV